MAPPGIGFFLATLYQATGHDEFLEAALEYLDSARSVMERIGRRATRQARTGPFRASCSWRMPEALRRSPDTSTAQPAAAQT